MSARKTLVRTLLLSLVTITCALIVVGVLARHRIGAIIENIGIVSEGHEWVDRVKDPDGVLAYLEANRVSVSLATWEVGHEDEALLLHADEPRSLASTVKVLVLAAYAQQVESGQLDPDSRVSLSEWDAFYLPRTDGGAHPASLAELEQKGRVVDEAVTLADVARAMIVHSDNAAADLVMMRVGRSALDRAPEQFATTKDEAPFPISGTMLLSTSAPDGVLPRQWMAQLEGEGRKAIADRAWAIAERLVKDDAYRSTQRNRLEHSGIGLNLREQEAFAKALFPRGTARGYAKLMERVATAPSSSKWAFVMSSNLEWVLGRGGSLDQRFDRFGTKGGSLPGVLTSATYAQPHGQPTRVMTLFLEDVPFALWANLMKTFTQQKFEQRLLEDPAFREKVDHALTAPEPQTGVAGN